MLSKRRAPSPRSTGTTLDIHLVNQAGLQVLLGHGGAAAQGDVFAPPRVLGPLKGCVDAFGDEVEGRAALHFERIAGVMRKDEDGHVEGRILSPPAVPGTVSPRTVAAAKHVAAHDGRPDVLEVFRSDVVVGTSRTAFHAMDCAESPRGEGPFMQLFAALARRVGDALIGAGDVPSSDIVMLSLRIAMAVSYIQDCVL